MSAMGIIRILSVVFMATVFCMICEKSGKPCQGFGKIVRSRQALTDNQRHLPGKNQAQSRGGGEVDQESRIITRSQGSTKLNTIHFRHNTVQDIEVKATMFIYMVDKLFS